MRDAREAPPGGGGSRPPLDPRLLRRVPALRRFVAVLAGLDVVAAVLVVAQALLLASVIVAVFGRQPLGAVAYRLIALGGVGIARAVLAGLGDALGARASLRVRADLRRATLAAIVRLGPLWARSRPPGRLVTTTGPGLDALDGYVARAVPAVVAAGIVPVAAWSAITWADWQSGVLLLVLLPLVPVFMALVGLATRRLVRRQYAALERLTGQFLDLLRGLRTLTIYGRAGAQERTLRRITESFRTQTLAALRVAFLSGLVLDLIAALSIAVVAVDVGLRLAGGHVSFGTALAVLLLAPELFAPLRALGVNHHAAEDGAAAAAAALSIIEEAEAAGAVHPPAADQLSPAAPVTTPTAPVEGVAVRGLTVRYPGRDRDALADVDLDLPRGKIVALTGTSGAGKSTLVAALLGFVTPTAGDAVAMDADGVRSLRGSDPDAWRAGTAWLPQLPRPSRTSVAAEVRLGDPDASDAQVAAACAACAAPDPATPIAEDGRGVSAGQRRRIALARVLLRARAVADRGGVPLVLLDEPSEDLDAATESVVAAVIARLRGWATVLVVTHSEPLAELADVRIEMADGRVRATRRQSPAPVGRLVHVASGPRPAPVAEPAPPGSAATLSLRHLVRAAAAGRRLVLAAALSATAALFALGLTATSMWLISRAAQHPNVQALAVAVVGVRTFAVGRSVLRYGERLATHDVALRMLVELRSAVFTGLRSLSPSALARYGRGDLLRRFVGDVDGAQDALVRAVVPLSGAGAGALAAIVIAGLLVPLAGAVLVAGLLLGGVVAPLLAARLAGDTGALAARVGMRDRHAADLVESLPELIAYGQAAAAVADVAADDAAVQRAARRTAAASGAGAAGSGVAAAVTLPLVLAATAAAVAAGRLGPVETGVLAVCVLAGFESVTSLPAGFVAWVRARAGLRRVAELAAEQACLAATGQAALPAGPLGLEVAAATVAPAADAPAVLSGADLAVGTGRRVALVGPSGCGKSTLLAAVLRVLPLRTGAARLAGPLATAALEDVAADQLPRGIAGSLQGDHVFDATLADNVRFVRPDATDADLDEVARLAGLLDVVRTLPQGWATPAGPDGSRLSGGQRQRLLLARALLADPQVLVLDEPTAHLDRDTERRVLADLLDATAGRTVLLSTHRPLAADQVDAVLRVQDGRLLEAAIGSGVPQPQLGPSTSMGSPSVVA